MKKSGDEIMHIGMTQQFSLSKTLRFELKPVFEDEDFIENFKSEFLKETVKRDEKRAEEYKQVKEIIDDYYREYIDETLAVTNLPDLQFDDAFDFYESFRKGNDDAKKQWDDVQNKLRESLASVFKKSKYELKKEFFRDVLKPNVGNDSQKLQLVESFDGFITYFTGFNENRKNIFTKEAHATAIGYRLIHDNLPKFFDACLLYAKIREKFTDLEFVIKEEWLQELGVTTLDELFTPQAYAHLLTQKTIDAYNKLLGGYTTQEGTKIKGLNEKISLYRQGKGLKPRDLPTFAPLFKQILSKHESASFIPEAFENDKELLDALFAFVERVQSKEGHIEQVEESFKQIDENFENGKIYIQSKTLSNLSNDIFGSWHVIEDALMKFKGIDDRNDLFKQDFYALDVIDESIEEYLKEYEEDHPHKVAYSAKNIIEHATGELDTLTKKIEDALKGLDELKDAEQISKNTDCKQTIKSILDAYQNLSRYFRRFAPTVNKKREVLENADMAFYNAFEEPFMEFDKEITALYNKTRNYLSKKPYSNEKFKLNFDSPTLLDGWDINQERANRSVLLIKDGKYYLAIMHPKHTDVFLSAPKNDDNKAYQKVNYKLVSGANKMLPKVFFSKKGIENYNPPKEVLNAYKNKEHKKGKTFNIESMRKIIDYFKSVVPKYKVDENDEFGWEVFGFNFSPTESYEDISQFYKEIEHQGYKIWMSDISSDYIEQAAMDGKIFLFQIYNKDFSPYAKGRPNMHTLYWKSLFEPINLQSVVTKLNGKAEIFFRYRSIKKSEAVVHKANQPIKNKNENNPKGESKFDYDIIKDRRYTIDKFLFHVPITINFKEGSATKYNDRINTLLAKHPNTHIIGIDRGERHLLYYTLISPDGKIIKQKSFNTIPTDRKYEVDYRNKLDIKEKERDRARRDWGTIENIKELKAGYLSQVVHELSKLIIEYNAIVVLEDLNFGFKRGRFKVEKQVYQKFEKALIDKLNYLVFKDRDAKKPGGYLNGYQLTAPFVSFAKLGKQSGILFYVPAAYTSKIDPATGFIDFLKPKYESVKKSQVFFSKFKSIRYNTDEDYFEFAFDYKDFTDRDLKGYKTDWMLCTHGIRLRNKKNDAEHWESVKVDVTDDLKRLFDQHKIFYKDGGDLKDKIIKVGDKSFFESLTFSLRNILAMRYSKINSEEDYILSPVKDRNGTFYDSRKADESMPKDADANGAYHIALKGAVLLERFRQTDFNPSAKNALTITQQQWLEYVTKKRWS